MKWEWVSVEEKPTRGSAQYLLYRIPAENSTVCWYERAWWTDDGWVSAEFEEPIDNEEARIACWCKIEPPC